MNANTKQDLKAFISAVEFLAQGVIHIVGFDTVKDVCEKAEQLKIQLDKDETIP